MGPRKCHPLHAATNEGVVLGRQLGGRLAIQKCVFLKGGVCPFEWARPCAERERGREDGGRRGTAESLGCVRAFVRLDHLRKRPDYTVLRKGRGSLGQQTCGIGGVRAVHSGSHG